MDVDVQKTRAVKEVIRREVNAMRFVGSENGRLDFTSTFRNGGQRRDPLVAYGGQKKLK